MKATRVWCNTDSNLPGVQTQVCICRADSVRPHHVEASAEPRSATECTVMPETTCSWHSFACLPQHSLLAALAVHAH